MPQDYRNFLKSTSDDLPKDPNNLSSEQFNGLNNLQKYAAMRTIGVSEDAKLFKEAHDDLHHSYRGAAGFLRDLGYNSRIKGVLARIDWKDVVS